MNDNDKYVPPKHHCLTCGWLASCTSMYYGQFRFARPNCQIFPIWTKLWVLNFAGRLILGLYRTCKVYQLVQGFAPTAVHATSTRWKLLQTDSYHFASNDATFYYDILQWSSMISPMHSTHSANRTSFHLDMSMFTVKWVENISKTYRVSHQVLPSYRSLTPRRWEPHHQCNVVGCWIIKLNLVPSGQDVEAKHIHTMLFFLHFALFRKQERWSKLI